MNKTQTWIDFYLDERNSALLYQALAEMEKDERLSGVYARMAETELKHARAWVEKLAQQNQPEPKFKPTWRTRTLIRLGKRFGPSMILSAMENMERAGSNGYAAEAGAGNMARQEQFHGLLLSTLSRTIRGGMQGDTLAHMEGRHRGAGGNALRAAVLGANDGLVSNLSLVMGVAGATLDNRTVLITGIAGLLAGAISMALGEWLSVTSSRELYSKQIEIESKEIVDAPEEEAEELALIYEARGFSPEEARPMAERILSDPNSAVETLVREELGIDPKQLGGSAWEAALTSFVLFSIGAIIPVVSFFFLDGMTAVLVSILSGVVGLFLLGAAITLFTGRTVLYSGMRMVVFGLLAAAVTFGIGRLIGSNVGG
ncbi:MAG: VIT1/CCC1 transporter family protein [Chloroflexi bacterium]|nr:VIT1/CCC1 transporter family protein [Chloroflexota bacterium]